MYDVLESARDWLQLELLSQLLFKIANRLQGSSWRATQTLSMAGVVWLSPTTNGLWRGRIWEWGGGENSTLSPLWGVVWWEEMANKSQELWHLGWEGIEHSIGSSIKGVGSLMETTEGQLAVHQTTLLIHLPQKHTHTHTNHFLPILHNCTTGRALSTCFLLQLELWEISHTLQW